MEEEHTPMPMPMPMPTPGRRAGHLLRERREAAGLTQEELAEAAGVSVRTVSNLETAAAARHLPRQDTLSRLAGALHLSADDAAAFRALARLSPSPSPNALPAAPMAPAVP